MSPYLIIASLVAVLVAGAGGFKLGVDHEQASQSREDQHIAQAVDAANAASAEAISKIKVMNKTIQNEVRHEVETNTVYSDCKLTTNGVFLANKALNGGAIPLGSGKLPNADTLSK